MQSPKDLTNDLNKILYAYISKGNPLPLSDNLETYVKDGYVSNVNIYPIIRRIVNSAIGVKWIIKDTTTGEPAKDQTLAQLLKTPNQNQTFSGFIDELITFRLVTGNRYIYWLAPLAGLNKGKPSELHSLPAQYVEIIGGDWLQPVKEYRLLIGDTIKRLPAESVVHGRTINLQYDSNGAQLYGMSPMQAALSEMTASKYGYLGLAKQYENGGPDVIITNTEGMVKGQPEYTEEQRQSLWQVFKSRFMGSTNKGKWLLKNHPIEVHEIGKSPVDLNTIAFLKLTMRDYCNVYGVPSVLMNDNEFSTYNNMKEARKALWNDAVIPELECLKDDFNKIAAVYNLAAGTSCMFEYDLSDIPELQEDKSVQASGLSQAYWMTVNERRAAMDLEPLEGMDDLLVPMGLMPMDELYTMPDEATKNLDQRGIKY